MRAYVGLGSNLGDGPALIRSALAQLDQHPAVQVTRRSSLYSSAPWGFEHQPDFTNAVAEVETRLEPAELLDVLFEIEKQLGRERGSHRWAPRSMDLDLLHCENRVSRDAALELPHPRMHQRAFVLIPLLELDPDFQIPGIGPARDCLLGLENQRVRRLL